GRQYARKESRVHGQGGHGRAPSPRASGPHPHLARGFRAFAHGLLRGGRPLRRRTSTDCGAAEGLIDMDAILVVNAGSSSVKFQIFGVAEAGALRRVVKGQVDGIATRPRLAAKAADGSALID